MGEAFYRLRTAFFVLAILLAIDVYAYQAIRIATAKFSVVVKQTLRGLYWTITVLVVLLFAWIHTIGIADEKLKQWIIVWMGIIYFSAPPK